MIRPYYIPLTRVDTGVVVMLNPFYIVGYEIRDGTVYVTSTANVKYGDGSVASMVYGVTESYEEIDQLIRAAYEQSFEAFTDLQRWMAEGSERVTEKNDKQHSTQLESTGK